jgi:hypothetical protein
VNDPVVLEQLDPVDLVPSRYGDFQLALEDIWDLSPHDMAGHRKIDLDPVSGQGISTAVPQRLE